MTLCEVLLYFIFARMNTKWYISTLLIIIALVGLNQEQNKVANQQIVFQFTGVETNSVTVHDDVLLKVTEKLKALGVTNIKIIENGDGQLRIYYFSEIDALSIGESLSQDIELSLDHINPDELPNDFPKDQLPDSYSIIISDIQQDVDEGLSLDGNLVFELNQTNNRHSNLVVFQFNNSIIFEQDAIVQEAYKINRRVMIEIDNTFRTIPEVRAGPQIYGNS